MYHHGDVEEAKSLIGIIPYAVSIVTCVMIFCTSQKASCTPENSTSIKSNLLNLFMSIVTVFTYMTSAHLMWNGEKFWKFDFMLGLFWTISVPLQFFLVIVRFMKKQNN
jgi:uncharacterized membrane protein